jgi:hypothetical protein
MKKAPGRKIDPTRERLHLQLRKDLVAALKRQAEAENRPLSRQFEVMMEKHLASAP